METRFTPADVPTSERNSNNPNWRSRLLAEPDIDQMIGPVFPMALNTKATIRIPPVSPGENEKESEKDIFNFPNNTPNTIPIAIGKKSVSERRFSSLPMNWASSFTLSFSPATINLSPNFNTKLGSGERSIPLRRTRVTVQPKVPCKFKWPSDLLIMLLLVSNRDCKVCPPLNGRSPSIRSPNNNVSCSKALSLPTAFSKSPSLSVVWGVGIDMTLSCFIRETTAPVMARTCNCAKLFPQIFLFVTLNAAVCNVGYWLFRWVSSALASAIKSLRSIFGKSFTKRITPITPNG